MTEAKFIDRESSGKYNQILNILKSIGLNADNFDESKYIDEEYKHESHDSMLQLFKNIKNVAQTILVIRPSTSLKDESKMIVTPSEEITLKEIVLDEFQLQ